MFSVQCEDLKINHLTLFLVVTMRYTCWFLWHVDYIEDFKWHLHFQFGVAFWRVVLRAVYFEEPNHVWRALPPMTILSHRLKFLCIIGRRSDTHGWWCRLCTYWKVVQSNDLVRRTLLYTTPSILRHIFRTISKLLGPKLPLLYDDGTR
jgi:hypothetical protein